MMVLKDKQINRFRVIAILSGTLLLGGVLRCWNITQSFWWDEIWSTMTYVNAPSLWQVVSTLGYYFNNHLLYSLLARASVFLLGESELAARLPALIMGLCAIIMVFQFGKGFCGTSSGHIVSFLLAISAFHIDHSSEARGYSGLSLFALFSSWYFLEGIMMDRIKSWVFYLISSVLGCYLHVFMVAVLLSQVVICLCIIFLGKNHTGALPISLIALQRFFVFLVLVCTVTLILYSPILSTFLHNLGKVRLVSVNRIPFILKLLATFYPGINTGIGVSVYGFLCLAGCYSLFRINYILLLYCLVLLILPLTLYLLANPMFVFERYFIFTLPFALLLLSQGMVELTRHLRGIYRKGAMVVLLMLLVYLQYPVLVRELHQDRQNYREAVRYIEEAGAGKKNSLVFTIGYAGDHFRYYARDITIHEPETLAELVALMEGKERIWCLVTAWLPDLRPPHEDRDLYAERPGQMEIYTYVKQQFVLNKVFASRYPVEVHYLEGKRGQQ